MPLKLGSEAEQRAGITLVKTIPQKGPPAIYSAVTTSAAIVNTAAITAFDHSYNIPANILRVGDVIQVAAAGTYGTNAGAQSLDLWILLAGQLIGGAGVNLNGGLTGKTWIAEGTAVIRSIGGAGSVIGGAGVVGFDGSGVFTASHGPNNGVQAIDTTLAQNLNVTILWGVASPSNTITMSTLTIEICPAQNIQ